MEDLRVRENSLLEMFGITFPNLDPNKKLQMHKMMTRVLEAPQLQYGHKSRSNGGARGIVTPSNGTWDMFRSGVQFYQPAKVDAWAVLTVGDVQSR